MRRQFSFPSSSPLAHGCAIVVACLVVISAAGGGVGLATAQSTTPAVDDSQSAAPAIDEQESAAPAVDDKESSAPAVDDKESSAPAVASVTEASIDESISASSVADRDSMRQESNLSVTIQLPRQIPTNVSLNYSVRTSGAEGNVSVTWDFEGETKTGPNVQHSFEEAGNATIEVTVTDESGSEVTETVTVSVVNLADDESQNPLDNIGTIAVFFAGLIGVPLILLIFVLPKAMEYFTDAF